VAAAGVARRGAFGPASAVIAWFAVQSVAAW